MRGGPEGPREPKRGLPRARAAASPATKIRRRTLRDPPDNGRHDSLGRDSETRPAILAAADALLTRVRANDAGDRSRSVDARLAELEDESRASALLTQNMAQQINALTLAHESAAGTARRGLALGIAALILAIAGVILAIIQ